MTSAAALSKPAEPTKAHLQLLVQELLVLKLFLLGETYFSPPTPHDQLFMTSKSLSSISDSARPMVRLILLMTSVLLSQACSPTDEATENSASSTPKQPSAAAAGSLSQAPSQALSQAELSAAKIALGKQLFFDPKLSKPAGRSCASCHSPSAGFADPDQRLPVSRGAHHDRFANRNTPTITYAAYTPARHYDAEEGVWVGGFFMDGRAQSLEAQLLEPMRSPLEMNMVDDAELLEQLQSASYASELSKLYGAEVLENAELALEALANAIASYERSAELSPFSSKYDAYLAGKTQLSAAEQRGLELFEAEDKGNCAACHPSRPTDDGSPALFTDFTYDNLGVPANPNNPFLDLAAEFNPAGRSFVDLGLGAELQDPKEYGKFKVPTLRNIALTAPYMHNGVFETLKEATEFYNSRDTDSRWAAPEVAANVNSDELGDLGLTDAEIDDLVSFMQTLSDGYEPDNPPAKP